MLLVSGLLVAVTGDIQGKIMTEQQPMKMAAAEALWETEQPAAFSIFTIGTPARDRGGLLDPDPVPPLVPRDGHLRRQGRGDQRPPGTGRRPVRARRLHAQHAGDVLDVPLR